MRCAASYCGRRSNGTMRSSTQSYQGRWSSNSNVQIECVMFLQRVFDRVRVRIQRVNDPLCTRHVMFGKADAIDHRVAHVDVG